MIAIIKMIIQTFFLRLDFYLQYWKREVGSRKEEEPPIPNIPCILLHHILFKKKLQLSVPIFSYLYSGPARGYLVSQPKI